MKELDLIFSLFGKKNDGNEKQLDDGSIIVDGVEMDLGDDEWDLEVFFDGSKSLDKFEGFWSDGYRGEGNYDGLYIDGNDLFYVDVINDGVVIKLEERV